MIEMQKGSLIPYFVASCKVTNSEEYIIAFEDIITPQQAKKLVTKQVYADEKLLAGITNESPLMWIGFNISDKHYGNIGVLDDVMQAGAQWIGKVIYKENEVLIPLVNETLAGIDIKHKILKTNLPEGLLEVYEQ